MEHLLCQTLEKVTEQNRHVRILTVLKYGNFKLCVPDEGRGNTILLRSTKWGGGIRAKGYGWEIQASLRDTG